jgi:hypothetical protein
MKFVPFLSMLLLAVAACSGGHREEQAGRRATGAFYNVYLKLHPSGVPTKNQQAKFAALVSADLAGLLVEAALAEARYAEATKGEAPPLLEGDLFTSLFEGAESYKIGQCEMQKESGACLVDLAHTDSRDNSKVEWKDRVYVVRNKDRWAVDDIEFLGDWQFMHKGRLKELLKAVIEDGNNPPA